MMLQKTKNVVHFLTNHEIWPVGLCVAASFVSTSLLPVAVIIAAFYWLIRWIANRRLTQRTPADWAILLLVLMLPVTLWATSIPAKTIPIVLRLLTGFALYYSVVNWTNTTNRLHWLSLGIVAAGLFLALFSVVSVTWPMGKLALIPADLYDRFHVVVTDTVTPNVMAGNLIILLPIPLLLLLLGWKSFNRISIILSGITSIIMVVILLLTKSRGAWMAFGAVLLCLPVLRWRRGWISLTFAVIAGGLVIYFVGISRITDFIASTDTIAGIDGRMDIWSRAIFMIQDFPITGIGMGSFTEVADTLYPFTLVSSGTMPHAHNLFLQIAVDLGLPGLIAWLSVLIVVFSQSWRIFCYGKIKGDVFALALGAGLLCSQVALVVHGLTDAVTWGMVRPAPLVWLVWGLTMAGGNLYKVSDIGDIRKAESG